VLYILTRYAMLGNVLYLLAIASKLSQVYTLLSQTRPFLILEFSTLLTPDFWLWLTRPKAAMYGTVS